MSSSILLAHSDLLRPVIFGQEWLRRLDACVRKSPDLRQARGTYQLRMTTTWTQVVLNIVLLLFDSSSFCSVLGVSVVVEKDGQWRHGVRVGLETSAQVLQDGPF